MQRGGVVAQRSNGEETLIGAIGALLILAAVAILLFEVAGIEHRGNGRAIANVNPAPAPTIETDAAGSPGEFIYLVNSQTRLP